MPIQILLVDDHPLFRAGVAAALRKQPDWTICAETGSVDEAHKLVRAHRPDVAVIDLMLDKDDGLRLVRELVLEEPKLRVVVLSMLDQAVYAPKALQAGARAFVAKRAGTEAIVAAVQNALVSRAPVKATMAEDSTAALSGRELQVFRELGLGRSTQEIAAALGVSVKTVESHREGIKLKLGLPHTNALVARAAMWVREQGLRY
jgi:DNA-binding NarL/FixJ family response regulator